MNKRLFQLLLITTLFAGFMRAQVISTFSLVYQTTQKGGIVYLANASLGCSSDPPASSTSSCANGAAQMPPGGSFRDNDVVATYIDIDGDPSTVMSSRDALNLPTCSQITKAFLFWGATGATTSSFTTCKMKVNNGAYQTITAIASQTNNTGFNTYHCYADVTSLLVSGGINATVTVADVLSNQIGGTNKFGSWCIAVVYKNDLLTMRQLSIFKGLANISDPGAPSVNIPISGFLTPTSGPVTFEVGLYVHDGDRGLTGDDLKFKGASSFVAITDAVNGSGDVMNSTVSYGGTLTPNRVPNMNNTAGLDADIFLPDNSTKNYIGNAATSATFQMTTSSETYLPQMVTTAIDVYEPDIRASVRVRDVNGGNVVPGDILEYTIKGVNIGSDPSVNTFITDTLDLRANYIPNSTRITYGAGTGTLSDATGDDRLDYSAASRTLKIRIGTGATSAIGGTVQNSTTGVDSTVISYSVMCTSSCVKIACSPTIQAQAYIWGTGAVSTNTYNNGSNPGIFDGFGCPIPGTTSSPITATACALAGASVTSPGCIGSAVVFSSPSDTEPSLTYNWSGPETFLSALQNPTLASVTSTMSGIYTVTLAVPGSSCKSILTTSLLVTVCTPTAVNDATLTAFNTAVSGDASTNDLQVNGATFSITAQPAGGTVTINSTTGQYTFTPSPGFTGVTTTTYSACQGTLCSDANITYTVFPDLLANPDIINTTPSVSTTGTLLANDSGITNTLGATYSVNVTQPATSTGTIVVNATTGQYTFNPNPAFTGTALTTYTVCNTAVNPQTCSTTSIAINVFPNPAPVNDVTTTVMNSSLVASASTNDSGTTGGTYSITAQPANGTVSINPANGQYTFTPATSFTGVTTATYQLCNGAPVTCSNAVITVTVHPSITANPDVVNTAPSVSATGSLLSNDSGITTTLGAMYSVNVTQPAASTGTIVVNPTTGQYTFNPNPAFTGTALTTYTVCNTAVNPQTCSTTSIAINVFPNPAPVNDVTTTVMNSSLVANASTNDSGTTGGAYSITVQATNGTVSINPANGQYTFTPATSFTGVTTATYQLCNGAPVSCANAVITVTVHPSITANPDVVNTTPSVSATGSLLVNDSGITTTLGATYSVNVTQPAASTGTIVVNPATGQYTFNPNPAFTGTALTTYTVCNTSVNPQDCSSTTIAINVFYNPLPVNDATTTLVNSSVSGNASTNDGGVLGGTYSITAQPSNGTVSINPASGQYTFTPATSFTGVTTATYQLCNGAPVTCSNAVITVTVHPAITANPNLVNTTPSVSATGSLLGNDSGITNTIGATYSISVTQPLPSTGTIVVNPTTGQYTFNPNPAFTGTALTSYTVCNTAVNPQDCSTTSITIHVFPNPVPVNDATTTVINTSVVANASTNDAGATGGTYSIINQPAGGTVNINPANGQYTFVPSAGFTGVTTATYNLCNGAPVSCSAAVIGITVYPTIVANQDVITTTPSVATSGTLSTNDPGVIPGGTYSTSVTQPAAAVGTIVINPATGQYTFNPNPAFTGTSLTTYTICNTAVNPVTCSNATIIIQAGTPPLAVNDATTTIINTAVTGTASTNDSGVLSALNPSYSISQPLISTGSITINPLNGVYSYTPATGFTGTTSATYTVCTVLAPCSSATITFSVYPGITTNSDVISTTPSVTTTGSLLPNDTGILTSGTLTANYSVTVVQPASTVGVIAINSATGQYTFTPNPAYTGSVLTTYQVCNITVNPPLCSTNTILIQVFPIPVPVDDATTTVVGATVSGNASANDTGTLLATYSITGQPAGGTISIVPNTGLYTFTPSPTFTGITTATYQLCNGAATTCSNAIITITVHPLLAANNDTINATPSSTVAGNLLGNDTGITTTLGATYSVTVLPPPSSTGTFVLIGTTGQYTFIPNPTFAGTVQTTYQVCNTAVSPQQCSTATIIINVFPDPLPANDATTTVINTTVSANASTNDTGTAGGSYSITGQPAGGTIAINPVTGQYTFTPAPTFTGVTTATYNLCNGAPVTCSTAVITITVYPMLAAHQDTIVTTPTASATGSLTNNDLGIVPGGTYSVSVTALTPTTGTISVNPATGQYTFIPNPLFTGSVSTTYTICNTSVNPAICTNTTIIIKVSEAPIAVNDGTLTLIDTAVSGGVAVNDNHLTGASFSYGTSSNGTFAGDPNTGQYTFTPAPGFTGTTSVTYTLCNVVSPPCATAVIVFTVYPNLLAVNDNTTTGINTAVSGSLQGNDAGLVNGGVYSYTVSQPSGNSGTITVNSATGQYTYTPPSGYTGTVVTTYTVCQYNGTVQIQCSTATITIIVGARSSIGLAKALTGTVYNTDGTLSQTYKIVVKNTGNQPLTNVTLVDNLSATYPSPSLFTVTSMPGVINSTITELAMDNSFNGTVNNSLVTLPLSSSLAVGKTDTVQFTVRVNPNGYNGPYNNSASVTAIGSGTLVNDDSDNGLDPDKDNDSDPGNNSSATSFTFSIVKIGVAKMVSKVVSIGGGCSEVTFKFVVKNYGTSPVYNVTLNDNLNSTFASPSTYTVISAPSCVNNILVPNANYTGSGNATNLLAGSSTLAAGGADTVLVKVKFCVLGQATFSNVATVSASSLPGGGFVGTDVSTSGNDPDPNNNNNPSDPGEDAPTVFGQDPQVFIPEGFSPNNDNVNDVLRIRGLENYPGNELVILNRWGNVVYKKKVYDNTWDGTSNQGVTFGDNKLPEGTYFYIVDLGDGKKPLKGFIYLNRAQR